jgi:Sec-independent protein translocase protein TatA
VPSRCGPDRGAYHPRVNDIVIILIVVLILVVIWRGPKTIPEIGKMFGRGVREARIEANKLRSSDDPPAEGGSTGASSSS